MAGPNNARRFARITLLLASVAGCQASAVKDEHLAHHIPEHRPPNFAAAVAELPGRISELQSPDDLSQKALLSQETLATRLDELRDIIDWLPELAADTEMRKPEWDQISILTQQLQAAYPLLRTSALSGAADRAVLTQMQTILERVQPLVAVRE